LQRIPFVELGHGQLSAPLPSGRVVGQLLFASAVSGVATRSSTEARRPAASARLKDDPAACAGALRRRTFVLHRATPKPQVKLCARYRHDAMERARCMRRYEDDEAEAEGIVGVRGRMCGRVGEGDRNAESVTGDPLGADTTPTAAHASKACPWEPLGRPVWPW